MTTFTFRRSSSNAFARAFSQDCQLCGALSRAIVCEDCTRDLPFRVDQGCPCCGEAGADQQRCGACLADPPYFDGTVCAFRYEFPLDRLLQAYKFRANLALTAVLADAMAAQLARALSDGRCRLPDMIMAMPLSAQRLATRGFNQSALLGRAVAERFGLRFAVTGLTRVRDTRPQAGLKRIERQRNVKNAFACAGAQPNLQGAHIALLDDVMTTGATMSAAAQALKQAGAATVDAWAVARALQHPL